MANGDNSSSYGDDDNDIDREDWALTPTEDPDNEVDGSNVMDLIPGIDGYYRDDYNEEDDSADARDDGGVHAGVVGARYTLALDEDDAHTEEQRSRPKYGNIRDPDYSAASAPPLPRQRKAQSAQSTSTKATPMHAGSSALLAEHNEVARAMLDLDADAARKRFWCTFPGCTMRLSRPSHLEKHMRTHTNERPHECTECDMAFKTKWTLKKHIRTHTGEKPFECEYPGCDKAFTQRGTYRRHQVRTNPHPFLFASLMRVHL